MTEEDILTKRFKFNMLPLLTKEWQNTGTIQLKGAQEGGPTNWVSYNNHLHKLKKMGLVEFAKIGNNNCWRLADDQSGSN